jgi:hypothetical protein
MTVSALSYIYIIEFWQVMIGHVTLLCLVSLLYCDANWSCYLSNLAQAWPAEWRHRFCILITSVAIVASVTTTELYYITGGRARDEKVSPKTWRIFKPYDSRQFSWQLVPPAHEIHQAQFWARCNFHPPPPGFIKNIFAFRSFCSKFSLFFIYFLLLTIGSKM